MVFCNSYDYSPTTQTLRIRMPSTIHDFFTAKIVREIERRLEQFLSTTPPPPRNLSTFLLGIENESTSDIFAHDDSDHKRSPDAAFCHPDEQFPGIVVETSYSQRMGEVERLADEYVMMSNGSIRFIIGLDVDYRGGEGGVDTVSVWRPVRGEDEERKFLRTECIVDHQV